MVFSRKRARSSQRTYPKRARASARASRTRLTRLIRKTVFRVSEPKEHQVALGKTELYHNSFYAFHLNNASGMPTQGTGDNMRVGDQINIMRWRIRFLFGQKADRPNVTFRWFILEAPKGLTATYVNFFINTTSNVLIDDPNPESVKVLKSGQMRPNEAGLGNTGGDEYTFAREFNLPYKHVCKFGPAQATTAHASPELYFVIMPYDAYGTATTDNIAYITGITQLFYKDP